MIVVGKLSYRAEFTPMNLAEETTQNEIQAQIIPQAKQRDRQTSRQTVH